MENTAVVLILLSMLGIVFSILGVIKGNIKCLRIQSRKSSLYLLIASFIICIIGGALVPVDENAVGPTNTSQQPSLADTPETQDSKDILPTGKTEEKNTEEVTEKDTEKVTEKVVENQQPPTQPNGKLVVHYIDVGQGASQLILTPSGKTMLIDAGNNDDEDRIVHYLKKQGVNKVDILIGTHPDADHIGGLDAVVDAFDIGSIYMPKVSSNTKTFESLLTSIANKKLKVTTAKAGISLELDDQVTVKMIAPVQIYDDKNNMSAVVKLTFGNNSFLFMGDAEVDSEQDMLSSGADLKADVLLVGHHGSNSSTSQSFLNAVQPQYAVIQVGDNNYGHPTDQILKRLTDYKIVVYRNDKQGNIIFTSNGQKITTSHNEWKAPETNTTVDTPKVQPSQPTIKTETPIKKEESQETSVYYKNCTAVREAGKAPLYKGDPGYSSKLDRDGDGIACE